MTLFFEDSLYTKDSLSVWFCQHSKFFAPSKFSKNVGKVQGVGYFFNETTQEPCFILPKVFVYQTEDGKNKAFGKIQVAEDKTTDPIHIDEQTIRDLDLEKWKVNVLYDLPLILYRAIDKYRSKRLKDTIIPEKDNYQNILSSKESEGNISLLDSILSLFQFYKDHQELFVFIYRETHQGVEKINWARTIRTCLPILTDSGIFYPEPVNRKKSVNYDEILLILFFNTLKYISSQYGFRITIDQPYSLYPDNVFKRMINKKMVSKHLSRIKNHYFKDDLVRLWNLLFIFHKEIDRAASGKPHNEYLLIRKFDRVFEDMVDELIGDNVLDSNLRALKKQQDGKMVDHLFKFNSLITNDKKIYYIGDSKYYKDKENPEDGLKGTALFKQYTYAKNVIQTQLNWYYSSNPKKKAFYLDYRDEITQGYNITPNFFIMGKVRPEYDLKKTSYVLSLRFLQCHFSLRINSLTEIPYIFFSTP